MSAMLRMLDLSVIQDYPDISKLIVLLHQASSPDFAMSITPDLVQQLIVTK